MVGLGRKREERELLDFLERINEWEIRIEKEKGREALLAGPDPEQKRQALTVLKLERAKKRVLPRKTFREKLLDQASYLSFGSWAGQAVILLCICLLLGESGFGKRETLLLTAAGTPLFGVLGIVEILRSFRSGMWELEETCRYNLRQIEGMRLCLFGLGDLIAAAVIFGVGLTEGYGLKLLILFFLVPLLISDGIFLLLANRFRKGAYSLVPVAAAFALAVFWAYYAGSILDIPGQLAVFMRPLPFFGILLGSAGLLGFACIQFLKETKEEKIKWSCV